MKQLIALAAIAALNVAAGDAFSAEDDAADGYIKDGLAKLAEAPPAPPPVKGTKARVLVDCMHGQPDDVVTLSAADMKEALAQGYVDNDKAAVAYALTLEKNQPKAKAP